MTKKTKKKPQEMTETDRSTAHNYLVVKDEEQRLLVYKRYGSAIIRGWLVSDLLRYAEVADEDWIFRESGLGKIKKLEEKIEKLERDSNLFMRNLTNAEDDIDNLEDRLRFIESRQPRFGWKKDGPRQD